MNIWNLLGSPSSGLCSPVVSHPPRKKTRDVLPFLQENNSLILADSPSPSILSPHQPQAGDLTLAPDRSPLLPQVLKMDSSNTQSEGSHPSVPKNPDMMTSCRKKKTDDVTFIEDLKDHIDEFIHASMDEHKTCFKKTIQKMFGMSKVVAERSAQAKEAEVESALPLQTSVSQ